MKLIQTLALSVAVVALVAALWWYRTRSRAPLAAVLFFAGTLFPALGFFNVYPFIYSFVADHFQHLASIGLTVLIAALVALIAQQPAAWARPVAISVSGVILCALTILTWRQSAAYKDQQSLWTDTLAKKHIPVILGRTQSLPAEDDDSYAQPYATPGELCKAGVRIAFASGAGGGFGPAGPHASRTIPYEAAQGTAFGLSDDDAMKALTIWPAEMFGVEKKLGSIAAGKIADVIVTDGSPLVLTTNVRHLIIAGREVSTDNRHLALYEKYRARPAAH
jgi:hypothetical protein